MSKNTIDLNKLKEELESRKQSGNQRQSGEINLPKDNFLYELENSLRSGAESRATNRIKLIENKAAEKNNETPVHGDVAVNTVNKQTRPQQQIRPQQTNKNYIAESPDREELMYKEFNQKTKNSGLGDALNEFVGTPRPQQKFGTPQMINEELLNENVKKIVNNYLSENLEAIFEEAIKETILELYAMDRIKTVISENKDIVKTAVYDVLREIQSKNKEKK